MKMETITKPNVMFSDMEPWEKFIVRVMVQDLKAILIRRGYLIQTYGDSFLDDVLIKMFENGLLRLNEKAGVMDFLVYSVSEKRYKPI